jgi:predicted AAA+ superfamily ATPase
MPFSREEQFKALIRLNQALIRNYPYQLQSVPEYHGFDAVLSPEEWEYSQPVPKQFRLEVVVDRMAKLELQSEYLVANVRKILADLDDIEAKLYGAKSSANFALKKADVVEYDVSLRSAGMESLRAELIEKLRQALSFPPTPKGSTQAEFYRC